MDCRGSYSKRKATGWKGCAAYFNGMPKLGIRAVEMPFLKVACKLRPVRLPSSARSGQSAGPEAEIRIGGRHGRMNARRRRRFLLGTRGVVSPFGEDFVSQIVVLDKIGN